MTEALRQEIHGRVFSNARDQLAIRLKRFWPLLRTNLPGLSDHSPAEPSKAQFEQMAATLITERRLRIGSFNMPLGEIDTAITSLVQSTSPGLDNNARGTLSQFFGTGAGQRPSLEAIIPTENDINQTTDAIYRGASNSGGFMDILKGIGHWIMTAIGALFGKCQYKGFMECIAEVSGQNTHGQIVANLNTLNRPFLTPQVVQTIANEAVNTGLTQRGLRPLFPQSTPETLESVRLGDMGTDISQLARQTIESRTQNAIESGLRAEIERRMVTRYNQLRTQLDAERLPWVTSPILSAERRALHAAITTSNGRQTVDWNSAGYTALVTANQAPSVAEQEAIARTISTRMGAYIPQQAQALAAMNPQQRADTLADQAMQALGQNTAQLSWFGRQDEAVRTQIRTHLRGEILAQDATFRPFLPMLASAAPGARPLVPGEQGGPSNTPGSQNQQARAR